MGNSIIYLNNYGLGGGMEARDGEGGRPLDVRKSYFMIVSMVLLFIGDTPLHYSVSGVTRPNY